MTSKLSVRHLSTQFKLNETLCTIVDDVSFELFQGETLAIVGESGCGKTTLALSLVRALPEPPAMRPTGEVMFKGHNLLTISDSQLRKIRGHDITMVFQDPSSALNPVYTVLDQLLEVIDIHLKLSEEEAYEAALNALKEVKIPDPELSLKKYPHELSGGQKQRVMIAMAIVTKPDILIADEPTTALDVTVQAEIIDLIKTLQKKHGLSLLLITHDIGLVSEIADRIMVMYASRIVEWGTKEEVLNHPSHPYTQGLLNSRPSLQKPGEPLVGIKGNVPSFTHMPKGCRFHPRCPFVMEICRHEDPPAFHTAPTQYAHCWLRDETPH